jgi:hypothetical protein
MSPYPSPRAQAEQEYFRLLIRTGIDFTVRVPSEIKILYRPRSYGSFLEWSAEVLPGSEASGYVYYDFSQGTPVPAAGTYYLRVQMLIDGKKAKTVLTRWFVGE